MRIWQSCGKCALKRNPNRAVMPAEAGIPLWLMHMLTKSGTPVYCNCCMVVGGRDPDGTRILEDRKLAWWPVRLGIPKPEQLTEAVHCGPRITGIGLMIIHPNFAGIDISKTHLDVFDGCRGHAERFENTKAVAVKLARRFKTHGSVVLFEATGRYDEALREAFSAQGVTFSRANPARARDFARATGQLAKTDSLDAKMLAVMAQSLPPKTFEPIAPEGQKLAALQLRRDQLVSMRAEEKTRREALSDQTILASINRHIALLSEDIAALEAEIKALQAAYPPFRKAADLLRSIPGIGPVTCTVFLARLPELGHRTSQEISALAGLAPFNADSGSMRGKRRIRGGRARVRMACYMAAVVAIRGSNPFAAFYKRLIAKGKPAKLALIAVARKILITANAVLRDQKPFQAI